ncbi:MAG TPA: class I SAM-dependent methyltransferase [Steroidobacteraceae bacterium]|nr:class I SAM-dependent methyltransferase [Steroidobacteraceae bacterium]
MATVAAHYREVLAPAYLWMAGGIEAATANGAADLADVLPRAGLAVDLGAGFGMHSIPLARAGFEVIAVDTSELLLGQLTAHGPGLHIRPVVGDLMDFPRHMPAGCKADLILCMGDTLTHLPDAGAVGELSRRVARHLVKGGRFVATFRDFTRLPVGAGRFIPVRGDADRILTCFLEDAGGTVTVHDILHQRVGAGWEMKVGSYSKLKLDADRVGLEFEKAGLAVSLTAGPRGMIRLVADA